MYGNMKFPYEYSPKLKASEKEKDTSHDKNNTKELPSNAVLSNFSLLYN
jgi:hypothetical protein